MSTNDRQGDGGTDCGGVYLGNGSSGSSAPNYTHPALQSIPYSGHSDTIGLSAEDVGDDNSDTLSEILLNCATFGVPVPATPVLAKAKLAETSLKQTPTSSAAIFPSPWNTPSENQSGTHRATGSRLQVSIPEGHLPATTYNPSSAHTRGVSDSKWRPENMPPAFMTDIRPRSRSDAPVSPGFPQGPGFGEEQSSISSTTRSSFSSGHAHGQTTGQNFGLAAPAPQRRLYPEGGVNAQSWSRDSELAKHSYHQSMSALPDQRKTQDGSNPQKTIFHGSRLPTIYDEDRGGTPGGVKLPTASGRQGSDPFTVGKSIEKSLSEMNIASSKGLQRSNTTGRSVPNMATRQYNSFAPGASRSNGNGKALAMDYSTDSSSGPVSHRNSEGSSIASAQPKTSTDKPRTAKEWADFIKSGACETPATPQHSSAQQTRRGTPSQVNVPVHTPYVLPQTVPHMNGPDPIVKSFIDQGRPPYEVLVANLPFVESVRGTAPSIAGVLKITDLPYSTTRQEIVAFFGRNVRFVCAPLGSPYYAIHIIMERNTAKSMDCFVEFETVPEAASALNRATREQKRQGGRKPRIGNRFVNVEMSSQAELMKQVFPRAKCVVWQGQHPVITAPEPPFITGFKGFISQEEMYMVTKFSDNPGRSRFSQTHVQRTYESMISTLSKYPWWATELYTLEERNRLAKAATDLTSQLANFVTNNSSHDMLTSRLLEELLVVGLDCPGFSEQQRVALVDASMLFVGVPRFVSNVALVWPFEILRRRTDCSEELLMYYVAVIGEQACAQSTQPLINGLPFGPYRSFMIQTHPGMTMAQVAYNEWAILTTFIQYGSGSVQGS